MLNRMPCGFAGLFPGRRRLCKVPYRARFRSDKHAAVLRLQRTQPKDRRVYDAPYRILCITGASCEEKRPLVRTGSTKSPREERGTECSPLPLNPTGCNPLHEKFLSAQENNQHRNQRQHTRRHYQSVFRRILTDKHFDSQLDCLF